MFDLAVHNYHTRSYQEPKQAKWPIEFRLPETFVSAVSSDQYLILLYPRLILMPGDGKICYQEGDIIR